MMEIACVVAHLRTDVAESVPANHIPALLPLPGRPKPSSLFKRRIFILEGRIFVFLWKTLFVFDRKTDRPV